MHKAQLSELQWQLDYSQAKLQEAEALSASLWNQLQTTEAQLATEAAAFTKVCASAGPFVSGASWLPEDLPKPRQLQQAHAGLFGLYKELGTVLNQEQHDLANLDKVASGLTSLLGKLDTIGGEWLRSLYKAIDARAIFDGASKFARTQKAVAAWKLLKWLV